MPGIGISPCPPFNKPPLAPGVLYDGNTVAWYKHNDLTNITIDGAMRVSQWNDRLGSGHDLLQGLAAKQPLWSMADGVLSDGINDYLSDIFVYNQPEMIYFVGRQVTWTNNDCIFDGIGAGNGLLQQILLTPQIRLNAGVILGNNFDWILNTFSILRILFNGINSFLQVNQNAPLAGNAGANNMGGFVLGASGVFGNYGNIGVKEIILRNVADGAGVQAQIYNYLRNVNGCG